MNIALWVVQAVLAFAFVAAGSMKVFAYEKYKAMSEKSGPTDLKRELVEATGALNNEGVADRVTFIVDPNNEIQFVSVTAGSVGRNVDEVLRILDALQTDELCQCNWNKGDAPLKAA